MSEDTQVDATATVADPMQAAAALAREMRRKGFTVAVIASRLQEEHLLEPAEAEYVVRKVFREPLSLSVESAKARMWVGGLFVAAATATAGVAYGLTERMGWFQGLMGVGVALGAIHFFRGFSRLKR